VRGSAHPHARLGAQTLARIAPNCLTMSPPGHPSGSGLLFAFRGVVYDGRLRTGTLASIPAESEWPRVYGALIIKALR
jgi:hypothetical protein